MSLNKWLSTGLVVWAISFLMAHGPVVFFYLFIQLITSGMFYLSIKHAMRRGRS